jgi:hypothetical protein
MLTRLRHAEQPLAATDKDLYAQLLFQLADMAADAGLRGIKHIGDLGQVKSRLAASRIILSCWKFTIHSGASDIALLLESAELQNK